MTESRKLLGTAVLGQEIVLRVNFSHTYRDDVSVVAHLTFVQMPA